ncbi:hypothetical protein CYPRO_2433 [Cyclonatronum proteinivorum]|uniref:Uncharacterized protein n=1 Tax=Cyclonatronum proteinivorum TaxID=1457365 RepID=A0A345UMH3_9BACT|nr:hypothetical protein CYPRO_2433 [Cyclonatronum proteinivorum]
MYSFTYFQDMFSDAAMRQVFSEESEMDEWLYIISNLRFII